ncbi:type II toxin-antitoxin system Phd/YefM family antitoxin [Candidatus Sumerlaeota bacterium]|nr:type II toxin-antitoxin system Phd/YefM family antitoxin [Candidatus Sumerlaeota bacterium]
MELHAEILSKNGKPEFAVLPYEEYLQVRGILADAEDLRDLREAKALAGQTPGINLDQAKKELGLGGD